MTWQNKLRWALLASAAAPMALATPALAQSADEGIGTVIVTAQKRS